MMGERLGRDERVVRLRRHYGIMNPQSTHTMKEQFFKIYANLPLNLREEIILVLPGKGPITWNVAYLEINNDTELGKQILEKLLELKII